MIHHYNPAREGDPQRCTLCDQPSLPGLLQGHGKCRYHWNLGNWGKEWADRVEREALADAQEGAE